MDHKIISVQNKLTKHDLNMMPLRLMIKRFADGMQIIVLRKVFRFIRIIWQQVGLKFSRFVVRSRTCFFDSFHAKLVGGLHVVRYVNGTMGDVILGNNACSFLHP